MRDQQPHEQLYAWEGLQRLPGGAAEGDDAGAFNWHDDGLHRHVAPPPAQCAGEIRLHQAAMRALAAQRYTEALDALWKGMHRYPENQLFPTTAGTVYLRLKILHKARECLEKALSINDDNPVATVALARLYGITREPTRARMLFSKVLQARTLPPHTAAQLRTERRVHAASCTRKRPKGACVQMQPSNSSVRQAWGVMEADHSNFHDARRILEEGLRVNPGHTSTLHALALVDMQFGDFKAARARLQHALRNSPRHAHSWATLGYLTYIEGSPAQARLVFENMISQCGANSVLYAMWGKMEARSGDVGALPWVCGRSHVSGHRSTQIGFTAQLGHNTAPQNCFTSKSCSICGCTDSTACVNKSPNQGAGLR